MTIYDDLPDDNQLAFLHLEAEFRKELEEGLEHADGNGSYDYHSGNYMNRTLAAANALGISALSEYSIDVINDASFGNVFRTFRHDVENIVVQIRINTSRRNKELSVGLSSDQKAKIHGLISKIRAAIEASSANVSKKEKIFTILSKLSEEVDKPRTRFERFADLARGLAGVSKTVAEEGAEPWWKWYAAAMGVVDEAKEAEPQLPKPPEVKRIEPPRKELPKPDKPSLDDEIPF